MQMQNCRCTHDGRRCIFCATECVRDGLADGRARCRLPDGAAAARATYASVACVAGGSAMLRALATVAVLSARAAAEQDAGATTASLQEAEDVAREFWERTNPAFAFLDAGSLSDVRTVSMMRSWHANFLGRYDWANRVVVDFGAATGLLGEWLLQTGGARHYVATDIAERAVTAARERLTLAGFLEGAGGRFEAVQAPVELCTLSATRDAQEHPPAADTLLSTKTLQHFASIQMLVGFLRNVRHSGIDTVMLQLVEGDETSCYGSTAEYARQSGPDSIIARLGHWLARYRSHSLVALALHSSQLTSDLTAVSGAVQRSGLCSVNLPVAPVRLFWEVAPRMGSPATCWSGQSARISRSLLQTSSPAKSDKPHRSKISPTYTSAFVGCGRRPITAWPGCRLAEGSVLSAYRSCWKIVSTEAQAGQHPARYAQC
eukprot:COSAG02_NODE_13_length_57813_cov_14.298276_18_plen_432_part_00